MRRKFKRFYLAYLFNALNCREFGTGSIFPNLLRNKLALVIIFATALLQMIMTQCVGGFFNAVALSKEMWFKIVGCGALVVLLNEMVKQGLRLAKHSAKTAVRQMRRSIK